MTEPEKCSKLIDRLQSLASDLMEDNRYPVHRRINQFFYMHKIAEMKILREQFEEAKTKLEAVRRRMDENYIVTYCQWRSDVRWLNSYQKDRETV